MTGTATTTAGGACAPPAVPPDAIDRTSVSADFDGDGANDTLSTYGTGTADNPLPWHLRLDRANGGAVDVLIPDASGVAAVRPLGGSEISAGAGIAPDGSGVEAFVLIGAGASTSLVAVFQYHDCDLVRLTGPSTTEPATFPIGGTVTHLGGLRCDGVSGGSRLVVLTADSTDGTSYQTSDQLLRIEGAGFDTPNAPIVDVLDAGDANLSAYTTITCPGVTPP
jgi:hypothetical protein